VATAADENRSEVLCEVDIPPYDDCLAVPVEIGGRKFEFLLDTGSTTTLFDPSLIKDGLVQESPQKEIIKAKDGFSRPLEFARCTSPELKIGSLTIPAGAESGIYDFARLRECLDRRIHGVVGMDIIRRVAIRIDWDARKLTFLKSGYSGNEKETSFQLVPSFFGVPQVFVGFPNRGTGLCTTAVDCTIDTGVTDELMLEGRTFNSLVSRDICRRHPQQTTFISAGGMQLLPSADLQGALFAFPGAGPWVSRMEVVSGERNLVGLGYLSRFNLTLDCKRFMLWYSKSKSFDKPRPRDKSGLSLVRRSGAIVVDGVVAASPAAHADLRVGDSFVTVNGTPATKLKIYDIRSILKRADSHVDVVVRRGTDLLRVDLRLPPGLPPLEMPADFADRIQLKQSIYYSAAAKSYPVANGPFSRREPYPGEPSPDDSVIAAVWKLGGRVQTTDIGGVPRLISVSLQDIEVLPGGLKTLSGATCLRSLNLHYCRLTDADLMDLAGLTTLESLSLSRNHRITDAGLKALTGMSGLRKLSLHQTYVTDAGLSALAGMRELRELSLGQTRITDAGLSALAGLNRIEYVDLRETDISDDGMRNFRSLTAITTLDLDKTRVTGEVFEELAALKSLAVLGLIDCPVTDAGAAKLAAFESLDTLFLGGSKVTDTGLHALAALHSLKCLDLSRTVVTGQGFKEFSGVRRLESLYCRGAPVTDEGLKEIGKLASLRFLDLAQTEITDSGLMELGGLASLKSLEVRETKVTRGGAEKLRERLPACKILR